MCRVKENSEKLINEMKWIVEQRSVLKSMQAREERGKKESEEKVNLKEIKHKNVRQDSEERNEKEVKKTQNNRDAQK